MFSRPVVRLRVFGVLLLAALIPLGCAKFTHSVSPRRISEWGAYAPQGEYQLITDVFLVRGGSDFTIDNDTGKEHRYQSRRLALTPSKQPCRPGRLYSSPDTIEAYEADPNTAVRHYHELYIGIDDVVGIVRKGTVIRCVRLKRSVGGSPLTGYGTWHTLYAENLSGEFCGSIADIEDLGNYVKDAAAGVYERYPDPTILSPVVPAE